MFVILSPFWFKCWEAIKFIQKSSQILYYEMGIVSDFTHFTFCDNTIFLVSGSAVIRLVSKTGKSSKVTSGILEVLVNNTWGTVCSRNFGEKEAVVACKQLGFDTKSPHFSSASLEELV
jgi:hypothetical protein